MKKLEKILAISFILTMCISSTVFAVPVKQDGSDTDIQITVTEKATATPKATAKASATPKATNKPSASPKASATAKATATTKPTSTAKATEEEDDRIVLDSEEDLIVETTVEPTLNIQNNSEQFENKKYLTKGGAFLWFLFTVIVSAIISFAISYRFYMMGRRDNHVVAELRALKRDIDSKMVGTVNGFAEYDVSVTNSNRSYSRQNSSIKSGIHQQDDDNNSEIYKKWETQFNKVNESSEPQKTTYTRSSGGHSVSRGVERRRPVKNKNNTVGGKIKSVFNDIFPFDKK